MKALEFESELRSDRSLSVPENLIDGIPPGRPFRVIVLIPEDAEAREWEQLAAAEFGAGYSDGDSIYDQLSAG